MKKNYVLILFFFVVGIMSAQEKLSKEEQARREKNIEAGNPFKQFGYKAKVATLSKGKYLEVHDLDSIVVIGSVRFHVDKKEIVGFVEPDTINGMYARPIGDMPSRWLSPDPLAEEFTSWSPYTMSFNNPIQFVDPDGRAADDWRNKDNKQVYNAEKQEYTEYATAQEKEFGEALRNSGTEGQQQFDALTQSTTLVTVNFNEGNADSTFQGLMTPTNVKVNSDGSETLVAATIDVNLGKITAVNAEVKSKTTAQFNDNHSTMSTQALTNLQTVKDNNMSPFQQAVGIFGHEIKHLDKNNFSLMRSIQKQQTKATETLNQEYSPERVEAKILNGFLKK